VAGFALQGLCAVERLQARGGRQEGRGLGQVVLTGEGRTCSVLDLAALVPGD